MMYCEHLAVLGNPRRALGEERTAPDEILLIKGQRVSHEAIS
jgi:hypothetical protein